MQLGELLRTRLHMLASSAPSSAISLTNMGQDPVIKSKKYFFDQMVFSQIAMNVKK